MSPCSSRSCALASGSRPSSSSQFLHRLLLCLLVASLALGGSGPAFSSPSQAQEVGPPTDAETALAPDATVPVPGMLTPNGLAVHPVTHRVYVTSRDNDRILMLDGFSYAVLNEFWLSDSPWGVAVDPQVNLVYAATFGGGTLRVLRAENLAPVTVTSFGANAELTHVVTVPGRGTVLTVSHRKNELYVVHGPSGTVRATQPTGGQGAWGLAYDPQLNRAYVSHRDSGTVTSLDGNDGWAQLAGHTIQPCGPGGQPYGLAVHVLKRRLYVACAPARNVNVVKVYGLAEGGLSFQASIPVGNGGDDGGGGIAINTRTGNVFFTNSTSNTVSVISSVTNQVIATLSTGQTPFGAAVDPVTGKVFVGNKTSNNLTVLTDTYPADPALPAITLSKQMTCASDQITVSGRNFPTTGGGDAVIYFDGVLLTGTAIRPGGSFDVTIRVPTNPGGFRTITAMKSVEPWVQVGALTRTPLPDLPVVFLPGLAGSELRTGGAFNMLAPVNPDLCVSLRPSIACLLPEEHLFLEGEVVWLGLRGVVESMAGRWRFLDAIALERDGRTPRPDVLGIRPNIVVGEPTWNIAGLKPVYQPLDEFLEAQGYVDGRTLFYFPYDWRKHYIDMDEALEATINLALQRSGKSKVILMAHSTGGVVARNYLLRRGTAKVDQLITMGTPYIGSPVAARAMEVGDDMGLGLHFGDLGVGLHPKEGKALAQNFPGLYDLLPSSLWFTPSPADRGAPPPSYLVRTRKEDAYQVQEPLDYAQSTAWLASRRNATLLADALTFQNQGIGDLSLLTDQYFGQRIASTGRATPYAMIYSPRMICTTGRSGRMKCTSKPETAIAINMDFGDDTIALRSAIGGNLPPGDDRYYVFSNIPHLELPGNGEVQMLLYHMLRGERCGGGGMPPNLESIEARNGSEVILIGDAALHVYDVEGNHAGPLLDQPAGIENKLPGVDYSLGDDSVVVTIEEGGPYTLRIVGAELNSAALLRVNRIDNNVVGESTVFAGMAITGTTEATLTIFGPGAPPSPLTFQYTPSDPTQTDPGVSLSGTAAQDMTPPSVTLARDTRTNLVTVAADDGPSGSGVADILYSTEYPPVNYTVYSGPVVVPASVHCVSAVAIDHAGNASLAQTACRAWLPAVQR